MEARWHNASWRAVLCWGRHRFLWLEFEWRRCGRAIDRHHVDVDGKPLHGADRVTDLGYRYGFLHYFGSVLDDEL